MIWIILLPVHSFTSGLNQIIIPEPGIFDSKPIIDVIRCRYQMKLLKSGPVPAEEEGP